MEDILIQNLCKSYDGKAVLQNLTLRLTAGETTCLMAPSGWGKTTLLRILLHLESPDSGTITSLSGLRAAAVFQEDRLLPQLTAADNLRLTSPQLTQAQAREALERLSLGDCAQQRAASLSGGEKRRTAILRALLWPWDILLLDEPFQGLDADSKALAIEEIRRRQQGRTILLVTHNREDAEALGAKAILTFE